MSSSSDTDTPHEKKLQELLTAVQRSYAFHRPGDKKEETDLKELIDKIKRLSSLTPSQAWEAWEAERSSLVLPAEAAASSYVPVSSLAGDGEPPPSKEGEGKPSPPDGFSLPAEMATRSNLPVDSLADETSSIEEDEGGPSPPEEHYLEMPGQTAPAEFQKTVLPAAAIFAIKKCKDDNPTHTMDMFHALLRLAVARDPQATHYAFSATRTKSPIPFPIDTFAPLVGHTLLCDEDGDEELSLLDCGSAPTPTKKTEHFPYNWWADQGRGFEKQAAGGGEGLPRDLMHRHSGTIFLASSHARELMKMLTIDMYKADFVTWTSQSPAGLPKPEMLMYAILPLLEAAGVGNKILSIPYNSQVQYGHLANTYPILKIQDGVCPIMPKDHDDWPSTFEVSLANLTHDPVDERWEVLDMFPWSPEASVSASDQEDPTGSWSLLKVCNPSTHKCRMVVLPFPCGSYTVWPDTHQAADHESEHDSGDDDDEDEEGEENDPLDPAAKDAAAAKETPNSKRKKKTGEDDVYNEAAQQRQTAIDAFCDYDPYMNIKSRFLNTRHTPPVLPSCDSATKNDYDLINFDMKSRRYTALRDLKVGTVIMCITTRLHSMTTYGHTQRASAATAVHYNVKPSNSFLLRPASARTLDGTRAPAFTLECTLAKFETQNSRRKNAISEKERLLDTENKRYRAYEIYYDTFNAQQEVPLFGIKKHDDETRINCIAYVMDVPDTNMNRLFNYFNPREDADDKNSDGTTHPYNSKLMNSAIYEGSRPLYEPEKPEYNPDANTARPTACLMITKDVSTGDELFLPNDEAATHIATYVEKNTFLPNRSFANLRPGYSETDGGNPSARRRYICKTEEFKPVFAESTSEIGPNTLSANLEQGEEPDALLPDITYAEYACKCHLPQKETFDTQIKSYAKLVPVDEDSACGYYKKKTDTKGEGLFASRSFLKGDTVFTEMLNVLDGKQKTDFLANIESNTFDHETYVTLPESAGANANGIIQLVDDKGERSLYYMLNSPSSGETITCIPVSSWTAMQPGIITITMTVTPPPPPTLNKPPAAFSIPPQLKPTNHRYTDASDLSILGQ